MDEYTKSILLQYLPNDIVEFEIEKQLMNIYKNEHLSKMINVFQDIVENIYVSYSGNCLNYRYFDFEKVKAHYSYTDEHKLDFIYYYIVEKNYVYDNVYNLIRILKYKYNILANQHDIIRNLKKHDFSYICIDTYDSNVFVFIDEIPKLLIELFYNELLPK